MKTTLFRASQITLGLLVILAQPALGAGQRVPRNSIPLGTPQIVEQQRGPYVFTKKKKSAWFSVNLVEGSRYTFRSISSTHTGGRLYVTDPARPSKIIPVAGNDNAHGDFTITYTARRTATYYLYLFPTLRNTVATYYVGFKSTATAANPIEEFLPEGALALVDASPEKFNSRNAPLKFSLTGAEFDTENVGDSTLTINGTQINGQLLTTDAHLITAAVTLADGRNDIFLKTYDSLGRPLYFNGTLWAGSASLQVNLVNSDNSPFLQNATITAILADDHEVTAQADTANGTVIFENMPMRTILLKAQGAGNKTGAAGVIGTQGTVTITMAGFNPPNPINNNDFSLGSAGWTVGTAPVSIVPHQEVIPGFLSDQGTNDKRYPSEGSSTVDQDLVLGTAGEGAQSLSRTFSTQQGTSTIRVRYRFVTSEVPGGYFGSQYNDYFGISIRTLNGGGFTAEVNSMNGLGLGAFHFASGSTNWREETLSVNPSGDVVQVDVAVANVGDGLYDSQVVVDFVQEIRDEVRPHLAWNPIAGGLDLTYEILNSATTQAATIDVHWANGPAYGNRIGNAIVSQNVPAGTLPGTYGPIHIAGSNLAGDPAGVIQLIAAASPTQIAVLSDVHVGFGTNADSSKISAAIFDVIKDGLRAAGQTSALIASTARTPADQARAMFQNLVNPANSIAVNIQLQLGIYSAPGDAVINVFAAQTSGLTRMQILQNQVAIKGAMQQEIINQGPASVSHHCADPNTISVVDVDTGAFNTSNGPLFVGSVNPRLTRFIDERTINHCYHLELNR